MQVTDVDLGNLNHHAYRSAQAQRQYSKAEGWLDLGEKTAIDYVVKQLAPTTLLDIGIGGGRTIPLMKEVSADYVGIDYVKELVQASENRFPNNVLKVMDARYLTFNDQQFDLVCFSNNGIDSVNFNDRALIIKQAHRVLKPNSYFVFSALNHDCETIREPRSGIKNIIKSVIAYPIEMFNKARLKQYEVMDQLTSVRVLNAHFNGLIATFISKQQQIAQLQQEAFTVEAVYDCFGRKVDTDDRACDSSYLHYVAKRV